MSKEGQKKKEEEKNCGFIKQKYIDWCLQPRDFFFAFFFFRLQNSLIFSQPRFCKKAVSIPQCCSLK